MKKSVRQNKWGNWRGYIGNKFVKEFAAGTQGLGLVGSDTVCGNCGTDAANEEMPEAAKQWLAEPA